VKNGNFPVSSFYRVVQKHGEGAGNTVDENSSVFSLIRMR